MEENPSKHNGIYVSYIKTELDTRYFQYMCFSRIKVTDKLFKIKIYTKVKNKNHAVIFNNEEIEEGV